MKIGFDIDGVVASTQGMPVFPVKLNEEWSEFFSNAHTMKGAKEALTRLSEEHEVYFITARFKSHADITKEWFNNSGIPYDDGRIVFMEDNIVDLTQHKRYKYERIRVLGVEVFYDDKEDIVRHLSGLCDSRLFTSWDDIVDRLCAHEAFKELTKKVVAKQGLPESFKKSKKKKV